MKLPKGFVSEKNLDEKVKDLLERSRIEDDLEGKYYFRLELTALKNEKTFFITYTLPNKNKRKPVMLEIRQQGIGNDGLEFISDFSDSIKDNHNTYATTTLGYKTHDEASEGFCSANIMQPKSIEDLVHEIIDTYSKVSDSFDILKITYNGKVYSSIKYCP